MLLTTEKILSLLKGVSSLPPGQLVTSRMMSRGWCLQGIICECGREGGARTSESDTGCYDGRGDGEEKESYGGWVTMKGGMEYSTLSWIIIMWRNV